MKHAAARVGPLRRAPPDAADVAVGIAERRHAQVALGVGAEHDLAAVGADAVERLLDAVRRASPRPSD
jgi:hypothetical protein